MTAVIMSEPAKFMEEEKKNCHWVSILLSSYHKLVNLGTESLSHAWKEGFKVRDGEG